VESTPKEDDVPDVLPHHRLPRKLREDHDRQGQKDHLDLEPKHDQKDTEIRSKNSMTKTTIKNDIVEHDSYQRETMRFIDSTTLEIKRDLSDLDLLALEFITILEKHTPYVIVSGYVSILLGRARVSEDIDIIIQKVTLPTLKKLVLELKENGFYCIKEEKESDIFEYLTEGLAVRFARQHTMIPNIELKWAKNRIQNLALHKTITVILPQGTLHISNLELQIAFKEKVLRSSKDREDARHIRKVAEGYLDKKLLQHYKEMLRDVH
jgi:hypothetical protein